MESLSAMPPSSVKYCYFGWKADSSLDSGITYVLSKVPQKAINLALDAFHQRKKHDRVAFRKKKCIQHDWLKMWGKYWQLSDLFLIYLPFYRLGTILVCCKVEKNKSIYISIMVCVKAELTTLALRSAPFSSPRLPEIERKRQRTFLVANARKKQNDCNAVTNYSHFMSR